MHLALDASLWDEPTTGIALVTRELFHALVRQGVSAERWGARHSGEAPRRARSRTRWALTELSTLLETRRPDVFHAFGNFNLPLAVRGPTACGLSVHDVIPLTSPAAVSAPFRWQFRLWLSRSAHVARAVVCPTEATRSALLRRFPLEPAKVHVVPHGADHVLRGGALDDTSRAWLDALHLREHFVLYAGALEARKNVELVVRACQALHGGGRALTLVLAGQRWFGAGPAQQAIDEARAHGLDVRTLGYVAEPVLHELMRRAGVFVFPSHDEGFGLPPLEAMRLGTATVVSDIPALREVVGDGALAVPPTEPLTLAAALDRLLGSSSERRALAARGLARASTFTWDAAARAMHAVWQSIADER
ncbi:MAG: glycosyltransferase family 4 protein [Myxococcaceae bacterium]|nr:glycosyltransferase family 4 protein [Myxococcaceae bacterium]